MKRPSPVASVLLLALLFGLVELPFSAFLADDFFHLSVLQGVSPATWAGPLDLYTISDGDPQHVATLKESGALPWFFDPGFKMAFFRPLSSALLAADHALFGLSPFGYRLDALLWFLLLVVGLGMLLRRALPGAAGALALLLFTVSGVHGNLFWTATRHVVVAASIGTFALLAHMRWREEGWRPGLLLSLAGFALSLAAGEAALGMLAYLLAWEAFAGPGEPRARLRALLPVAALVAAWLAMYRLRGLGAAGGGYLDPTSEPLLWLVEIPGRVLALLGAMLTGVPADLWVVLPSARPMMMAGGAAALLLFLALLRLASAAASPAERRAVGWLAVGALLSALPFAGSPIGGRCLVIPLVGSSAALGFVLHRWWTVLRREPGPRSRLVGVLCVAIAFLHLVLAPLQRLAVPVLLRKGLNEHLADAMRTAELEEAQLATRRVIILAAPDIAIGLHSYFYRRLYRLPMPERWRVLSWAPCNHVFRRADDNTLEMDLDGCELEMRRLEVGDTVELSDLRATVLEGGRDGVRRAAFRFDRALDDPSLWLLVWKDGRLWHLAPPKAGERLLLPWNPLGAAP